MIIFGHNYQILNCEAFYRRHGIKSVRPYNLSSYNTFIPQLHYLIPDVNMMGGVISDEEKEFDRMYASYVLGDDRAFIELMTIMMPLYEDPSTVVFIEISDSEYRSLITESLIKLIQQRYGYNCNFAICPEDCAAIIDNTFSIVGLLTMDKDMFRYVSLMGGVPNECE